jgi:phosphate transport system substrate-binding protein
MLSMKALRRTLPLAVVAALAVGATSAPAASAKPIISVSGSTSFYPLMVSLATQYLKDKGSPVKFSISQGGSDVGIADTAYGRVTMGMSSRDEKGADAHGLGWSKIARDALCIITNKANPIRNFNAQTVRNIFTGKVTNWSRVPGSRLKTPIAVIGRSISSGTQDMFQKLFLGFKQIVTPRASLKLTSGLMSSTVSSNKNAIGYVSLGFTGGLNVPSYDGIACNLRNAKSGQYLAVRNFWLVTPGYPTGEAAKFIDWAQTARTAQAVIAHGYVPLN